MLNHLKTMIRKHRNVGVVFDTNLLLLLVVGLSERSVNKHKRLSAFVEEDFMLIKTIAEQFHTIAAPSGVIAEVSNIIGYGGTSWPNMHDQIIETVTHEERSNAAIDLLGTKSLRELGYTDSLLCEKICSQFLFITDDHKLYSMACRRGDAINFNHIRPLFWKNL
ncbi:MAG: hypothetical protein D3925_05715 [Candidatus Electrothrix sp. AR5]|nr:hypothetical protein [Candidatus Electrothrix sp. AR5]